MKSENRILYTSIPKFTQLNYYQGVLNFTEKSYENDLSDYNWQKMKTRSLLENDDILAAPVQRRISHIHLIFPEDYTKREIINFMITHKIILNGPLQLENGIYLECILYTLTFRLSEWTRMNKYFVRSSNFFNRKEPIEAVRLQLLITDGCLALSTWALRLKLPSMSLIDLGADLKALFKEGFSVVRQKVLTLPNLKPATAICVYLKLPLSCPFRSYDELRQHWKNLYEYNLPQNESGILYIEVTFNRSNFTYIYPLVCVFPYEPIQLKCKDELKLIDDFAESLRMDVPKICRHDLQINVKNDNIFHPISKLYLASEVIGKPNLSLLVADNQVIQDFQRENVLTMPNKELKKRSRSPPSFFPSFERVPQMSMPQPSNEPFKCFPIFKPKNKTNFKPNNSGQTAQFNTFKTNFQRNSQEKIAAIKNPGPKRLQLNLETYTQPPSEKNTKLNSSAFNLEGKRINPKRKRKN